MFLVGKQIINKLPLTCKENIASQKAGINYSSSIENSSSTDIPRYLDILRASSKEAFLSPRSIRPIVRPQEPIEIAKSS